MNYQEVLEQAKIKAAKAKEHRIAMLDAYRKAEKTEQDAVAEVRLLEEIYALTQQKANGQIGIWEWGVERTTPRSYDKDYKKIAWRESHKLKMAGLEFIFRLCERLKFKRDKWHVVLKGIKTLYGKNITYYDYEYMHRKYREGMDMKFRSEEDARKFIHRMKNWVFTDHKEEINQQINLSKSIEL